MREAYEPYELAVFFLLGSRFNFYMDHTDTKIPVKTVAVFRPPCKSCQNKMG